MARASILAALVDLVSSNNAVDTLLSNETDGDLEHVYSFGFPGDELQYQPRRAVVIRRVPGGGDSEDFLDWALTNFVVRSYGGTNAEAEELDLEVHAALRDVYQRVVQNCRIVEMRFLDGPEDSLEVLTDILRIPCGERSYQARYFEEEV